MQTPLVFSRCQAQQPGTFSVSLAVQTHLLQVCRSTQGWCCIVGPGDGHRARCLLLTPAGCQGSSVALSLTLPCSISLPRLIQGCSPFPPLPEQLQQPSGPVWRWLWWPSTVTPEPGCLSLPNPHGWLSRPALGILLFLGNSIAEWWLTGFVLSLLSIVLSPFFIFHLLV